MRSTELLIGSVALVGVFFAAILFVAFGQITVRKLRKNPDVRNSLGIDLYGGDDITNVALALALPRSWIRKIRTGALSGLHADADLLYKHTTLFDRCLGRTFFGFWVTSVVLMLTAAAISSVSALK